MPALHDSSSWPAAASPPLQAQAPACTPTTTITCELSVGEAQAAKCREAAEWGATAACFWPDTAGVGMSAGRTLRALHASGPAGLV